ncbi:hypothetical protein WMY93_018679 [Mugilogobius chulae]|uniref:UBA domain-containing protein n=1 Tax=Mugilogobius chulae TaxID=88201 RepID=A0AAW0NJK1_9GOBI
MFTTTGSRASPVVEISLWRIVCLDIKDSFCSSLLLYNFRIFERRFGSRKFASFLLGTWFLSALTDVLLTQAFHFLFDYEVEELPAGMLAPVFSLFVPFYNSVPRMPVTQILGQIHITNKSLVYIVGLQLLTSSPFMWLLAVSGLISGALYHFNFLKMQKLVFVPVWVSRLGRCTLEPIFSSAQPVNETPIGMGATLDIQRQQRMDMPRPTDAFSSGGLLQWTRLFPSLRHRGQNHPTAQPRPQGQAQASTQQPLVDNSPASEEQVARLVEMGFSRIDALEPSEPQTMISTWQPISSCNTE